jgi:prepilin-type N-terminal cleavage/methylation domain-containing protein
MGRRNRAAFTLTELLVVIAIIAILAALLLGSLSGAKERGRRAACKNQLHQFYLALQMYSGDFADKLPSTPVDGVIVVDEHIPLMPRNLRAALLRYCGSARVMDCPSLGKPFGTGWRYDGYGYVIGYNYLGGKHQTPWEPIVSLTNTWISPQNMTENPQSIILTDMNDWSPGYVKTFAPHGRDGSILKGGDFSNPLANGVTSAGIGAMGGNSCNLGGAVQWKNIKKMLIYHGSQKWGSDGCYAMW